MAATSQSEGWEIAPGMANTTTPFASAVGWGDAIERLSTWAAAGADGAAGGQSAVAGNLRAPGMGDIPGGGGQEGGANPGAGQWEPAQARPAGDRRVVIGRRARLARWPRRNGAGMEIPNKGRRRTWEKREREKRPQGDRRRSSVTGNMARCTTGGLYSYGVLGAYYRQCDN